MRARGRPPVRQTAPLPSGPVVATFRLLLAGALGAGCAVLVACGSSGATNLVPSGASGQIKSDLDNIATAVGNGDCSGATQAINQAQTDVSNLPSTVDPALRQRIVDALANLSRQAPVQCQRNATTAVTTTAPTTDTTTTTTTTTPSTDTTTTPRTTDTTTAPSTDTVTTPSNNGGGTTAPGSGGTGGTGAGSGSSGSGSGSGGQSGGAGAGGQ